MAALAENERDALVRLLAIAASDTGTSRRVADFLLSWWNKSSCGGFDLVDLWYFSEDITADCLIVFRYVGRNREYPDSLGYGKEFEALVRAWRPHLLDENKPAGDSAAIAQLRTACNYRADHFDADAGVDSYISGADMLDWFAGWRREVLQAFPALKPALVFCSVCGEDHSPPECNDEFPEPGQIRETGK